MTTKQSWDTKSYQRDTGFVSELGEGVLEWLAPKHGEHILDLGCGDGILTQKIADTGAHVVGVDASESFIDTARSRGLDARVIDGHVLPFDAAFNAVFSNAALHWMMQPEKVVAGVAKALKPGGRFVGEFGGFGNLAALTTAMRAVGEAMGGDVSLAGPWFYPTPSQYSKMLEAGGFEVQDITTFCRPTPLPNAVRSWLEVLRRPFFEQFGARSQEAYERVEAALAPSLRDNEGQWIADYVRLRFRAQLRPN